MLIYNEIRLRKNLRSISSDEDCCSSICFIVYPWKIVLLAYALQYNPGYNFIISIFSLSITRSMQREKWGIKNMQMRISKLSKPRVCRRRQTPPLLMKEGFIYGAFLIKSQLKSNTTSYIEGFGCLLKKGFLDPSQFRFCKRIMVDEGFLSLSGLIRFVDLYLMGLSACEHRLVKL